MLFRGLLYFMVHANRRCPQFADKSCTCLPLWCPFPPGLRLSPTSLLSPKLPIKTNLASREIKPTLAEEWHQLQVSHCAFCIWHSTTPLTFCLPLILSAILSNSLLCYGYFFLPDPHLPSALLQMNAQLQKRPFHNMVIVYPGHLYGWVHDPNSQIQYSSF